MPWSACRSPAPGTTGGGGTVGGQDKSLLIGGAGALAAAAVVGGIAIRNRRAVPADGVQQDETAS